MKFSRLILPAITMAVMVPSMEAQGRGRGPAAQPPAQSRGGGASQRPDQGAPGKDMRSPEMRTQMKASQDLARNERLSTRLQPLFPPGTDMTVASQGFKNMGQFVAAAHVAKNLDLPFDELKARMTTGSSLGDALHALKPNMDKSEVKRQVKAAEHQAKQDLKEAPTPPAS